MARAGHPQWCTDNAQNSHAASAGMSGTFECWTVYCTCLFVMLQSRSIQRVECVHSMLRVHCTHRVFQVFWIWHTCTLRLLCKSRHSYDKRALWLSKWRHSNHSYRLAPGFLHTTDAISPAPSGMHHCDVTFCWWSKKEKNENEKNE